MTKTIITKVIIITKMRMRIRIGNRIKNETLKKKKSVQVKAIHICLKGRNVQKAIFYWNAKITCCRWLSLSLKKKAGYIIPTMNCYPRNGQLRDPDFTRRILYHPNQQQYSQHPILWVVLNISTKVLRARFTRVLSQHSIKQVGFTKHFKTSLVRNSGNINANTQKPCNENQSLKSTDLRQTQRFIES